MFSDTLFNILIFLLDIFLKYTLLEPPCVLIFSTLNINKTSLFCNIFNADIEKRKNVHHKIDHMIYSLKLRLTRIL